MKRWMKILISIVLTLLIAAVGTFLYIDHKVTKAMVDMAKKQERMAMLMEEQSEQEVIEQVEESEDHSSHEAKSVEIVNEDGEESSDENEVATIPKTEEELVENENIASEPVKASNESAVVSEDLHVTTISESATVEADTAQAVENSEVIVNSNMEVVNEDIADGSIEELKTNIEASNSSEGTITTSSEDTNTEQTEEPVESQEVAVEENVEQEEETPTVSEVAESVSFAEKAKAYELALSRLTTEQIDRLYQLAAGGFTKEEKEEAKSMFYANFTADEQQWILEMYSKYY